MQVPVLNLRKGQTAGLGDNSTSFNRGEVRRALVETSRKPEEEFSKDSAPQVRDQKFGPLSRDEVGSAACAAKPRSELN